MFWVYDIPFRKLVWKYSCSPPLRQSAGLITTLEDRRSLIHVLLPSWSIFNSKLHRKCLKRRVVRLSPRITRGGGGGTYLLVGSLSTVFSYLGKRDKIKITTAMPYDPVNALKLRSNTFFSSRSSSIYLPVTCSVFSWWRQQFSSISNL